MAKIGLVSLGLVVAAVGWVSGFSFGRASAPGTSRAPSRSSSPGASGIFAVPRSAREAKNPVGLTPELLAEARAHFADHCASCPGNDGRGQTEIGQNLYPKAPDMTLPETQFLSDGECSTRSTTASG